MLQRMKSYIGFRCTKTWARSFCLGMKEASRSLAKLCGHKEELWKMRWEIWGKKLECQADKVDLYPVTDEQARQTSPVTRQVVTEPISVLTLDPVPSHNPGLPSRESGAERIAMEVLCFDAAGELDCTPNSPHILAPSQEALGCVRSLGSRSTFNAEDTPLAMPTRLQYPGQDFATE